jgi:hypothetical protein
MNSFKSVEDQISMMSNDMTNLSASIKNVKQALLPRR